MTTSHLRAQLSVAARTVIACVLTLSAIGVPTAHAQDVALRGFGDIGSTTFAASDSFEAVLGSPTGVIFGGGGEVVLGDRVFINVRASRFQKDGSRVAVVDDETFDLGIDTTVQVVPIELTGGYRFFLRRGTIVPYAGGGIGWHRYKETSQFADDAENVDETHTGFHLLGGAEFRVTRWFAVAGEAQWSRVPDALGQDPNGVSASFDETDLGGLTVRAKFVVGR